MFRWLAFFVCLLWWLLSLLMTIYFQLSLYLADQMNVYYMCWLTTWLNTSFRTRFYYRDN